LQERQVLSQGTEFIKRWITMEVGTDGSKKRDRCHVCKVVPGGAQMEHGRLALRAMPLQREHLRAAFVVMVCLNPQTDQYAQPK
jgi:hypothetical protein